MSYNHFIEWKNFTNDAMSYAINKGANEVEIYLKSADNISIEVKEQKIETIEKSKTFGYGIRIIKDKKMGFSFSTIVDNYKEVIENAISLSTYCASDDAYCLAEKSLIADVAIYDAEIANINEDKTLACALQIESSARSFDERIKKVRSPIAAFSSSNVIITNSNGVNVNASTTSCFAQVMVVAEDLHDSQSGWSYASNRRLGNMDFVSVGKDAAQRAIWLLNAKKSHSFKGLVVFDTLIACEFLAILSHALSAEAVLKKKSFFADKVGKCVLSQMIDIIDDGTISFLAGSKPFDAEGYAVTKKTLIRNGVLEGFLYNSYTAKKADTTSSGNAVRGGYAGTPSVGQTNLFISPSNNTQTSSFENIIKSVPKGIYVVETMGMHTANPISGEYSIGLSGIIIENGDFAYPVKEAVISGNILDLFKNIVMISDSVVFHGSSGSPALLVQDIDISG